MKRKHSRLILKQEVGKLILIKVGRVEKNKYLPASQLQCCWDLSRRMIPRESKPGRGWTRCLLGRLDPKRWSSPWPHTLLQCCSVYKLLHANIINTLSLSQQIDFRQPNKQCPKNLGCTWATLLKETSKNVRIFILVHIFLGLTGLIDYTGMQWSSIERKEMKSVIMRAPLYHNPNECPSNFIQCMR